MATPPPRQSINTTSRPVRQSLSAMQVLLQMGFPKHRSEKALAATGDRGVQLAADWLLAHVNDSTLDDNTPREYILYLCPTGPLLDQLDRFFQRSLTQCGRNGAHNYIPHITLCSFFQAPDDLVHALEHVVEKLGSNLPDKIRLDHYTSATFLGLFVAEEHNDLLKRLAMQFMRDVSDYILTEFGALDVLGTCFPWCSSSYPSLTKGGSRCQIQIEPYLKALHITLAYQFLSEHYSVLENLLREVDTTAPAGWELRLYSRDIRIKGNEIHKVLYSHMPKENDELELLIGDFVYVAAEQLDASDDGWVEGTSWLTGCTGLLPKNYIERTAESDAWTLHKSVALSKNFVQNDLDETLLYRRPPVGLLKESAASVRSHGSEQPLYENIGPSVAKASRLKKDEMQKSEKKPRQLFVFRHAERVDFTFGDWISMCFDSTGKYKRKDLNMPSSIPPRSGGPNDYSKDSPLTKIGLYQATLTGEAVKESGIVFSHVFCSPALRCVQTCTNILKAAGQQHLSLSIEPGLFEWLSWYQDGLPVWLTVQELIEWGFNINPNYKPLITVEELTTKRETSEQYYMRNYLVSQTVLKNCADHGGNVLLLGHAATLDTCTRQLIGKPARNVNNLVQVTHRIPYCGVVVCLEDGEGKWSLINPPFPTLVHGNNMRFDWRVLMNS